MTVRQFRGSTVLQSVKFSFNLTILLDTDILCDISYMKHMVRIFLLTIKCYSLIVLLFMLDMLARFYAGHDGICPTGRSHKVPIGPAFLSWCGPGGGGTGNAIHTGTNGDFYQ